MRQIERLDRSGRLSRLSLCLSVPLGIEGRGIRKLGAFPRINHARCGCISHRLKDYRRRNSNVNRNYRRKSYFRRDVNIGNESSQNRTKKKSEPIWEAPEIRPVGPTHVFQFCQLKQLYRNRSNRSEYYRGTDYWREDGFCNWSAHWPD